jgi:hypothetical protein
MSAVALPGENLVDKMALVYWETARQVNMKSEYNGMAFYFQEKKKMTKKSRVQASKYLRLVPQHRCVTGPENAMRPRLMFLWPCVTVDCSWG